MVTRGRIQKKNRRSRRTNRRSSNKRTNHRFRRKAKNNNRISKRRNNRISKRRNNRRTKNRRKKKGKINADDFYETQILPDIFQDPWGRIPNPDGQTAETIEGLGIDDSDEEQEKLYLCIDNAMGKFMRDNGRVPFFQLESNNILLNGIRLYELNKEEQ